MATFMVLWCSLQWYVCCWFVWLLLGVCCCCGCCCPNGPEYKVSDLVFKWSAFNLSLKCSMIRIRWMQEMLMWNKNWKLIKGKFSVSMRKMTNEDFCAESFDMNCLEWPLDFLEGAWESAEPISFDPMDFSFLSASYTVSWLCFFSDVCSRLSGLDDRLD